MVEYAHLGAPVQLDGTAGAVGGKVDVSSQAVEAGQIEPERHLPSTDPGCDRSTM